jgi:hypothetical protein
MTDEHTDRKWRYTHPMSTKLTPIARATAEVRFRADESASQVSDYVGIHFSTGVVHHLLLRHVTRIKVGVEDDKPDVTLFTNDGASLVVLNPAPDVVTKLVARWLGWAAVR